MNTQTQAPLGPAAKVASPVKVTYCLYARKSTESEVHVGSGVEEGLHDEKNELIHGHVLHLVVEGFIVTGVITPM